MDVLKREQIFLYTSLFFMFVNITNSVYCLYNQDIDKAVYLLCINTVLSILFFIPYKLRIKNLEVVYGIILLLWVIFSVLSTSGNVVDYSILITYCIMLIIKNTKIKVLPIIIISLSLLLVLIIDMTINNGHVVRMVNNLLLISVMCLVHYFIYYKEYVEERPDLKKLYGLTLKEIEIIDMVVKNRPTPSTKEIAFKLGKTQSTLNTQFNNIYERLEIPNSGNRKVDLALLMSDINYI